MFLLHKKLSVNLINFSFVKKGKNNTKNKIEYKKCEIKSD